MPHEHLTNGFLPVAPFRHLDPTAVGVVDLDQPAEVVLNRPADPSIEYRDQLVLVRLHGDPLAIVHLEHAPGAESPAQLAAAIWQQARPAVRAHVARHSCAALPESASALEAGIPEASERGGGASGPPEGATAVIIATGGRPMVLERTLRSLADERAQIVVVDNRPGLEDTRELVLRLAAADRRLRYVPEPTPGLSVARNTGIAHAPAADYYAFIDDDIVADRAWLRSLLTPLQDSQVGVVTGLVLPLALHTPAQKRFELYAGFGKGIESRRYDREHNRADDRFLYPYWGGLFGGGGSVAFRRETLRALGGFDPALGAGTPTGGGEDLAIFSEAILAGVALVYEPRALCWHEHRRDEDALTNQLFHYGSGFTAALTKAACRDPRLFATAARTAPVVARVLARRRRRRSHEPTAQLPAALARIEWRGRLSGPFLYAKSVRRVRRLALEAPRR